MFCKICFVLLIALEVHNVSASGNLNNSFEIRNKDNVQALFKDTVEGRQLGQYGLIRYPQYPTNQPTNIKQPYTNPYPFYQPFGNRYPPNFPYRYPPDYQQEYPNRFPPGYPNRYPPQYIPNGYPNRPTSMINSLMDVLHSVARNDDLQCVPKLLCEITSGAISARQQSLGLPFNIDMSSLLGLLSTVNRDQQSPIVHFGKAALLGYANKGSVRTCNYAYPNCPSDPDKLVQYLNNHNGGFFRYFNGINNFNPQPYGQRQNAEARIQTKPAYFVPQNIVYQNYNEDFNREAKKIQFHDDDEIRINPVFNQKNQNGLRFPDDSFSSNEIVNTEYPYRSGKKINFNSYNNFNNYDNEELNYQKPLPNHKASPMIFPDRTGTGDLRLDAEELDNNYNYNRPFFPYK